MKMLLKIIFIIIAALNLMLYVGTAIKDFKGDNEDSKNATFVTLGVTQNGVYRVQATSVSSKNDGILSKYEKTDKKFKKIEIGNKISFWHQRMIDGAIVEGDYINYQFDKNTNKLLKKRIHWRNDLPEDATPKITKEKAESRVKGKILSIELYIISPNSVVFPVKSTSKNPSWVIRSVENGNIIITIIDSIDGNILGYGVPPPYTGFSFSGPMDMGNCGYAWDWWYKNAEFWFNKMGYSTEAVLWPDETKIQSHIQSFETAMFYELAHGGSYGFSNSCSDDTNAIEIHSWIENFSKIPFTFIGSCDGMCDLSPNLLSYEFRKGSLEKTVTVGYCGMSTDNCASAWTYSILWQDAMFNYMDQGDKVKEAFEKAITDYPVTLGCMRFAGDENFAVVPTVYRSKILATIDIDPDIMNLRSKGKLITGYVELPESYKVKDIDIDTIMLNNNVPARDNPAEIGDYDIDGHADLMIKFDRLAVQKILDTGDEVEIIITGKLKDGTPIEGRDNIRVIE